MESRFLSLVRVALSTHSVGVCRESQRLGIVRGILAMHIVAMAAVDLALLKAG
jgi:hypothetical protein